MPYTKATQPAHRMLNQRDIQFDHTFISIAEQFSALSYAKRSQVGCVIVKDRKIISTGYNGTPSGVDNLCETDVNTTKPYVLHAELNAVLNATTHDLANSTVYVTMSPCQHCAAILIQKNVGAVVYKEQYRDASGIDLLKRAGISCEILNSK